MRHIISALVENRPGVLAKIAALVRARGYNIDSLSVGETDDPTTSRMTFAVIGDDRILEQVTKQLNRLIDVIKVLDFTGRDFVERELVLVKVSCLPGQRGQIIELMDIFRGRICDLSPASVTVEATGAENKIEALIELLRPYGIKEIARTGLVALLRGEAKERNGGSRAARAKKEEPPPASPRPAAGNGESPFA
jgi:acetolactate synthase I/III small subunit